jgi:3-oxoacyl-(acyl-carrier-protein) synthase
MNLPEKVVITGTGVVAADLLQAIFDGEQPTAAAPAKDCVPIPEITAFETPEGAPAWGFEAAGFRLSDHISSVKGYIDRCSALAMGAAKKALDRSGLSAAADIPGGLGLCFATTFGCLDSMELFWAKVKSGNPKFAPPLPFTHAYANSPSSLLAIEFGLRGHSIVFSGDVSSGMIAAGYAASAIRGGHAEAMLAGASEALSAPRWRHHMAEGELFSGERWLALEPAGSDGGIVPGEGAAFIAMESATRARLRGARAESELAGWSIVSFGAGIRNAAEALESACRAALAEAGAKAGDISALFLASPCVRSLAGAERSAMSALFSDIPWPAAYAPKCAGGDALAVSPLWGIAMASGYIAGRLVPWPAVDRSGAIAGDMPPEQEHRVAMVNMLDPWGQAGAVVLRSSDGG